MGTFRLIWLGQFVSLFGTRLTEFALAVWLYQKTESITQFAFIFLFIYLPNILVSPVAGALVDRWNRRWAMILSDGVAGVGTLVILALTLTHQLQLWHVYVGVTVSSIFNTIQGPAYAAAVAQLIPPQDYGRANGMVQVARGMTKVISPAIAGYLIGIIQLQGILMIDWCTFMIALWTLLLVRIPDLKSQRRPRQFNWLIREILSGWHYITQRPSLFRLLLYIALTYFTLGMLEVMLWPLILDYASSEEFGLTLSLGSCGAVVGSVLMSVWGGPKRKVYGILGLVPLQAILMILGGVYGQLSVTFAGMGIFGFLLAQPIIVSCNQAIWQSKVPAKLQGRVFALQHMLEKSLSILAYAMTGPLLERILAPLLTLTGPLGEPVAQVVGVGPGRGIGFLLIGMGSLLLLATLVSYRDPLVRRVDTLVPDAPQPDLSLVTVRS